MEKEKPINLSFELYKAGREIQSKITAGTDGYGYKYCTLQDVIRR